jgi:predicted transcriptional regulator
MIIRGEFKMITIQSLFLNKKGTEIFLKLNDIPIPIIKVYYKSLELQTTYNHVRRCLNAYHLLGLTKFKKEGRVKTVVITEKGKEMQSYLNNIIRISKENIEKPTNLYSTS